MYDIITSSSDMQEILYYHFFLMWYNQVAKQCRFRLQCFGVSG